MELEWEEHFNILLRYRILHRLLVVPYVRAIRKLGGNLAKSMDSGLEPVMELEYCVLRSDAIGLIRTSWSSMMSSVCCAW